MRFLLNSTVVHSCKILCRSVHLDFSPNWKISKKIWDRYRKLPVANCKIQATYVWIDGSGENVNAKTRVMDFIPSSPKECPNWDFDGSHTGLADIKQSDIILCPVALYNDPLLQDNNKLLLCETYTPEGKPTKTNHRHKCMEALNEVCDKEPMFGFEQVFQLMDVNDRPFGWPVMLGEPSPIKTYHYVVGAEKTYGREIIECVFRACLYSGVEITGSHAVISPGQWEVQIGATIGVKAADDLWVTRYLLQRIAEDFGVAVSFKPKRFKNWQGCGCHTNFSTKEMRDEGGYKHIQEAIKKLEKNHGKHIRPYNLDSAPQTKFTSGVSNRTLSCRISKKVEMDKKGHFEDRRPPANADPYQIINVLVENTCGKCK